MTQARKIIDALGGAQKTAELLGYTPATVYRWTYPKSRGGTDGLLPSAAVRKIRALKLRIPAAAWAP